MQLLSQVFGIDKLGENGSQRSFDGLQSIFGHKMLQILKLHFLGRC